MTDNNNDQMYYAIVDVIVTNDASTVPLEYTGIQNEMVTSPYSLNNGFGTRLDSKDVNSEIGGDTTTIWVKYELLPKKSSRNVLTGISPVHWISWKGCTPSGISLPDSYEPVSDGWQRANGTSAGKKGALTTATVESNWCIGLCVKYEPMNNVNAFITNLYLTFNESATYPAEASANGGVWEMQKGNLDIHKGGHGVFVFLCVARTLLPIDKISLLQYNTHLFKGSLAAKAQELLNTTKVAYADENRMIAIVNNIIKLNPDIVCLQEVWGDDFRQDFKNKLCSQYPYFYYITPGKDISDDDIANINEAYVSKVSEILEPFTNLLKLNNIFKVIPKFTDGLLIFSKYNIMNCKYKAYDNLQEAEDRLGKKGVITFSIQVPISNNITTGYSYKTICLGTTHAPTSVNIEKVPNLNADAYMALKTAADATFANRSFDSILLGDFNVHYYEKPERELLASIMNNYGAIDIVEQILPDVEDSYTDWPYGNNLTLAMDGKRNENKNVKERIDYVYFSPALNTYNQILTLQGVQVKVLKDWKISDDNPKFSPLDLSDHRPVFVTLNFKKQQDSKDKL